MIQFLRESQDDFLNEATMNYNNDDTKLMVDYITSTFGLAVSSTRAGRGADLIYTKEDKNPRHSFMIYIDAKDVFYIVNATQKEMTTLLGTKRWKASNDKKNATRACEAIVNEEVGKRIAVVSSQSQAHDKLSRWLRTVGISPSSTSTSKVVSATPVAPKVVKEPKVTPTPAKVISTVAKTAKKVEKSTKTLVLGKSSGKTKEELEKTIFLRLRTEMDMSSRLWKDRFQVDEADKSGWIYASFRNPDLFKSRPGEEDDDWPEFVGYQKVLDRFKRVFKDMLDLIEFEISGEEKAYVSVSVRVKDNKSKSPSKASAPKTEPTKKPAKDPVTPATSGSSKLSELENKFKDMPMDYKWVDAFKAEVFKKKKPLFAGMWKPVSGFANRGQYVLEHPALGKKVYVSFRTSTTYGNVSQGSRLRDPAKTRNYVEVEMWLDGGGAMGTLYRVSSRGEGEDARARSAKSKLNIEQVAQKVFGITSVSWG